MTRIVLERDEAPGHLAARILNLRENFPSGRAVAVGIGGPSAAGKGQLIEALKRRTEDALLGVLELDRYYLGNQERKRLGVTSFDDPAALDLGLAAEHVARLKRGERVLAPIYDFPSAERVADKPFGPCDVLLVDGLFALRDPIVGHLDLKIFIETDPHSALLRRLFRDAGPAGRTKQSSREVIGQFFREVLPAQRSFIDPTWLSAEAVVRSRYDAAEESDRAGARELQMKFRGTLEQEFLRSIGAEWVGTIVQHDRYLVPKDRDIGGETVRIRQENGAAWIFTYKGPLIEGLPPNVRARAKRDVELSEEDAWRLYDAYREIAVISKTRRLHALGGAMLLALDDIPGLGNFVEFRGPLMRDSADPALSHADLEKVADAFRGGGADLQAVSGSYLDLWLNNNG